jgi:glutamate/tyrosine decarboxylase-like PLP-dependent enzyme
MLYGARNFRAALSEKLQLAERFNQGLAHLRDDRGLPLEIAQPPQLSTVAFRLARAEGESLPSWNARNVGLVDAINASGRVFLSKTSLPVADGQAQTLRMCALSYRCSERDIDACLEVVEDCVDEGL